MDQERKHSRFNFFGNTDTTDRISEEEGLRPPSNGGNTVPEQPKQHKAKRHHSEKDVPRESTNDYQQFIYSEEKLTRPKRVKTENSFRSQFSTAWSSTKEFAVSHLYVPRVAAPWEHESHPDFIEASGRNTVRSFNHQRQRRRLMVNSCFQLLVTTFLCACLVATLYGFSTIITGMTNTQKKAYNALVTGLSMLVGLNLASSLTGYAQMMRWRFLASKYRTLQDFELVLQCESQAKVFRLIWAGRTRGKFWPNGVQILAFCWILLNVALQVVVALLGLTYSIDISNGYSFINYNGNTSIAYLQEIKADITYATASFADQSVYAHSMGIEGGNYPNVTSTLDDSGSTTNGAQEYEQNSDMTEYWYRFIDRNPNDWSENVITSRTVNTTATCTSYKVTSGGQAGFDDNYSGDIYYTDAEGQQGYINIPVALQATNDVTWVTQNGTQCGDRCSMVWALFTRSNDTCEPLAKLYQCNNTVGQVTNIDEYGTYDVFGMPDPQARIFAGSIGWNGIQTDDGWEYQLAESNGIFAPCEDVSHLDMARLVMEFTAGALAAYDFSGARAIAQHTEEPFNAQVVDVEWNWAIAILAAIPGVQGLVMLAVARWANKAIIKDTSYLGAARLLRPIVDKLGPHGCLLTGDEICDVLGNYKIIYGARVPEGTMDGDQELVLKHLDLIEETEGRGKWRGRMPGGKYDGVGRSVTWDVEKEGAKGRVDEVEEDDETERKKWWRSERKNKRRNSF